MACHNRSKSHFNGFKEERTTKDIDLRWSLTYTTRFPRATRTRRRPRHPSSSDIGPNPNTTSPPVSGERSRLASLTVFPPEFSSRVVESSVEPSKKPRLFYDFTLLHRLISSPTRKQTWERRPGEGPSIFFFFPFFQINPPPFPFLSRGHGEEASAPRYLSTLRSLLLVWK